MYFFRSSEPSRQSQLTPAQLAAAQLRAAKARAAAAQSRAAANLQEAASQSDSVIQQSTPLPERFVAPGERSRSTEPKAALPSVTLPEPIAAVPYKFVAPPPIEPAVSSPVDQTRSASSGEDRPSLGNPRLAVGQPATAQQSFQTALDAKDAGSYTYYTVL